MSFVTSGALGPVILPFESHALAVEGDKPAVGDRNPARALLANPDIGVTQIAHRLGVSPATPLSVHPRRTHREYPGV